MVQTLDSSYEADVDTDADYDQETMRQFADGYFHESAEGYRSAPYFDVQIDGITLLDTTVLILTKDATGGAATFAAPPFCHV